MSHLSNLFLPNFDTSMCDIKELSWFYTTTSDISSSSNGNYISSAFTSLFLRMFASNTLKPLFTALLLDALGVGGEFCFGGIGICFFTRGEQLSVQLLPYAFSIIGMCLPFDSLLDSLLLLSVLNTSGLVFFFLNFS